MRQSLFALAALFAVAAGAQSGDKKEDRKYETFVVQGGVFAYDKEHVIRAPSESEWRGRVPRGVPYDAVRCGGPLYVRFDRSEMTRTIVVGVVVSLEGDWQGIEPLTLTESKWLPGPRLLHGTIAKNGEVAPIGDHLVLPEGGISKLYSCALAAGMPA